MPRDGNAVVQLADAASHAQLRVELFGIPTSRPAPSANLSSASFSGMNVQWQVFGEHVQQTMVLNSRPAGDRVPFTIWQRATLAASDGAGGALLHAIGSAATWGGNWDGELGNGNTTNQSSPVQVQGLSGVTAIAAGRFFSLAVKSDGTVWAWGDNESGQLGNGTNTNSLTPVQVQGFTGVSQLKAGEYFVLALKPDGSVWGWGDNPFGQLGLGTNSGGLNTPQHITTLTGVSLIGTGGYHSLAEKTDGTLWTWGGDWDGELGYAATQNCTSNGSNNACGESPAQVTGISGLAQLTGAAWHSLVLKNDGTVWAWGGNWFGELGNGTTTNSTTPVQATGLTGQTLIAAGREHSMSATASRLATTTYAYDKLYRLTGAAGPSGSTVYSYDPNGNRLSKVLGGNSTSYSYDKADRILTAGSTSYTVNAAGNVTARGSDAFGYDQANRLTSATTSTGSSSYAYDGDGKRVSKVVAGVTTNYVYDVGGGLPVLLDDGTQKYVWGANGLAESVNKTSSAVAVYHTDGLGSVRALSDSTGSVTQTYQTDEFGVPTTIQGGSTQPFGFTGEQTDPASGFSYLRARMYDPSSGRFMQHDTSVGSLTSAQSLNRYTYVVNRPTSLYDPTGHTATQSNVLSNISATTPMFTDAATGASSNQQDVLCLPMLDPFGFGGAPVCFPNPFGSGQAQVPARSGSITAQLQQARAGKELATYSITLEADPLIGYVTVDEGISAFSALYATYLPARARRSLPAAMALARVASNISKYPPNGVSQIGHIFIVPFQYGGDTWHFDLVNNYGVNFKS